MSTDTDPRRASTRYVDLRPTPPSDYDRAVARLNTEQAAAVNDGAEGGPGECPACGALLRDELHRPGCPDTDPR